MCIIVCIIILPLSSSSNNRGRWIPLWDGIGMSASGLCVLHCAAMPIVIALLPFWPVAQALHGWMHLAFAVIIVPATVSALWIGFRRKRTFLTPALLTGGLAVILAALLIEPIEQSKVAETLMTLAGSSLLIAGHWRNWKSGASCSASSSRQGHRGSQCND